jgi:hypothetical protein
MQQLVESISSKINETTDSGNIAFIPGSGAQNIRKQISSLLKHKQEWGVEVISEGDNYSISFEGQYKILVPKLYYKEFNEMVMKVDGVKTVNFSKLLQEAISTEFDDLLDTLVTKLKEIPEVKRNFELLSVFKNTFPNVKIIRTNDRFLIDVANYENSISLLLKTIAKRYSEDTGYLERLSSAVEEGLPLNAFGIFKDYSYLAGCSVVTIFDDVTIRLDLRTNMAIQNSQQILLSDESVAEDMKYYKEVKVVGNTLMPTSEFTSSLFMNLKNNIRNREIQK